MVERRWLQVKVAAFKAGIDDTTSEPPPPELLCAFRADGGTRACIRVTSPTTEAVADAPGVTMMLGSHPCKLRVDVFNSEELLLAAAASPSSPSADTLPLPKQRKQTLWETMDRWLALLSVGAPLDLPIEMDGYGERSLQPSGSSREDDAMNEALESNAPWGTAVVDLEEASRQWMQQCFVPVTSTSSPCRGLGQLSVRLCCVPVLCSGTVELRSRLWGWAPPCHAELLGTGELRLYSGAEALPNADEERSRLRDRMILSPPSDTCEAPVRMDTCEVKFSAAKAEGRGRSSRADSVRLRLSSSAKAREWLDNLKDLHKCAVKSMEEGNEEESEDDDE